MLVLSRKVGEKITVFNPDGSELMQIQLVWIDRNQARVGIEIPLEYRVMRNELLGSDRADGYVDRG